MLHSASLHDPTVAYPPFAPYPSSPSANLTENHVTNGHPSSATCAAVAAFTAAAAASAGMPPNIKDSRWLTLEVCRQYQRNQCSRDENECKFAHPPTHVDVQNGRVVCCYDSIKGKCQRRDPPCKYLHPPQHLREQLMQNGRNNMIFRNMQLHLFQQQLLAQSSMLPFNAPSVVAAATAAAAAVCTAPITNSSPIPVTNAPNSLIYPAPGSLALGNPAVSNSYQFLNLGFSPYLGPLTGSGLNSHLSGPGSEVIPTDTSTTPAKRPTLGDTKSSLSLYLSRNGCGQTNGTGTNKLDNHETSGNCLMVVGNSIDSSKEMNGTTHPAPPPQPMTLRTTTGTNLSTATAATLFALQHPQNPTLVNLPPHPGPPQHLSAASLAAVVNGNVVGNSVAPTHFSTMADHAGYFHPTYHIEIPPYPYH